MQTELQKKKSMVEFVTGLLVSLLLFSWGFRFISIPFFLLWIYVFWFTSGPRYTRRQLSVWFVFFASLFIPIDFDVGGWHGTREGVSPGGIHFVRYVKGIPTHSKLIERYGEYISGGCVMHGPEPRWILVWK